MQRILCRLLDQRDERRIAHRPDAVTPRYAHEAVGLDASPLHVEVERRDQRIWTVADGGDDGARRDEAAIAKLDRGRGRRLGADSGLDVDAIYPEPLGRIFGKVRREGGQDAVGILDEIDVDLLVLDVRIIFQRAVDQIVDLGDGLHAGEPGARPRRR